MSDISAPKTLGNRRFHNVETSTYWLPNDESELDRLDEYHFTLKDFFEGNVLGPGKSLFEKPVKALDVGCGPGTWVLDMSTEYPKSDFTGVDLRDVTFPTKKASNSHFLVGNVLTGLPFPDNTFDFVQMRLLVAAIRVEEWPSAMKELMRVTKPGGLIQSIEIDLKVDENDKTGLVKAMCDACTSRGQDPRVAIRIKDLLTEAGAQVLHTERREVNLGGDDALATKFISVSKNSIHSMLPVLGPILNIDESEGLDKGLDRFCDRLRKSESRWYYSANLAQKPE
ncbi:S-adenosyl-L-methionine-dependent methyltransferase [Radiomyces spectabilis]|uniref:S-adenosyl-L-methionine-dependent methyltransferase n=1 Tax=Radiomyces spectabilis TaxID=64574 RepID=UPI00222086E0|nr:S-adenosyl-L-methionine-dependent methyltransferase [Radiomyces spectabilis]KAI8391166.1 S-adenosyl-L-methionine-dependent methyltransferase [Radiomyces spectabilis]